MGHFLCSYRKKRLSNRVITFNDTKKTREMENLWVRFVKHELCLRHSNDQVSSFGGIHPGKFGNTSAASNILDKFTLYQNNFLLFRSGLEALCDMIKLIVVGYSKGIPDGILTITLFGFCYPFLLASVILFLKYNSPQGLNISSGLHSLNHILFFLCSLHVSSYFLYSFISCENGANFSPFQSRKPSHAPF